MKIIILPVTELTEHENNAKIHTPEQIACIANSIKQFGMNDPIGIWGSSNIIVEGHGRVFALRQLGINEVPCIRLDHLTDEERRAYMITHNQTTLLTHWDFDKLEQELKALSIDMGDYGLTDIDCDINIDEFFAAKDENSKNEKPKLCPHCGGEL